MFYVKSPLSQALSKQQKVEFSCDVKEAVYKNFK